MSYVRGIYARAACDLIDELGGIGVSAHVGYVTRKRTRTLVVKVIKGDIALVPPEWRGFAVDAERYTDPTQG